MYGYHQESLDTCGDGDIDVKGEGVSGIKTSAPQREYDCKNPADRIYLRFLPEG